MGLTQEFTGVKQIDGTTSSGTNSITIEPGVRANASLTGGSGSDSLTYDGAGNATLTAGTGADQLTFTGSAGNATLHGGNGSDTLIGATGNDLLTAGNGPTELRAGTGKDTLEGGTGGDSFFWQVGDGPATIAADHANSKLEILGTPAAEQFTVSAAGAGVTLQVPGPSKGSAPLSLSATGIQQIDFEGDGGADTFTINNLAKTSVTTVGINLSDAGYDAGGGDKVVINGDQQVANQVQIAPSVVQGAVNQNDQPVAGVVTSVAVTPQYAGETTPAKFTVYAAIPDSSDTLTVNTGAGNDNVMVQGTQPDVTAPKPGGQVFIDTGIGNNSVTVGGPGSVDSLFGHLTISGANLTIDDQPGGSSSAKAARGYTLGATGLSVASVGQTVPPPQISFSNLASLTLKLSNEQATSVDVESVPSATTIVGGNTVSTINVSPIGQNLDMLQHTITVQGGFSTTANLYDQANRDEVDLGVPNLYSSTWDTFTRTGYTPSKSVFTLDYSNLAAINMWAASELGGINRFRADAYNNIQIQGVLTPLTINAGTSKDQITDTLPAISDTNLANEGIITGKATDLVDDLTINGDGASLTLNDGYISNSYTPSNGNGPAYAEVNGITFTVTSQSVVYHDQDTNYSGPYSASAGDGIKGTALDSRHSEQQ